MPEHIRALIVILFLSSVIFFMIRKPALQCMAEADFKNRRKAWYVIMLLAFLSGNFWFFVLPAGGFLIFALRREQNPVALYFFLLFTLPVAGHDIPGFGVVNYLFTLSFQGLLAILILWKVYFQQGVPRFGKLTPDKLLAAYLLLLVLIALRDTTLTDALRKALYLFLEVFLPYFVIARFVRNIEQFREVMMSMVVALAIQALIGTFESSRHWLLYDALIKALGLNNGGLSFYLGRAGLLRAQGVAGQSIVLGYLMVLASGFFLYLQTRMTALPQRMWVWLILIAGLIAALSRGPWMGMLALLLVYTSLGKYPVARLLRMGAIGALALTIFAMMPGGTKVIDLLPYVGKSEQENVTYRENLFDSSLIVIKRNLLFGSTDFAKAEEFDKLRQQGGFVDFVNSYVGIALGAGIVGLSLFGGFFLWILASLVKCLGRIRDKASEEHLLGRVLLATMASILVMIVTVSSITFIPIVYWSVAGLCVAYSAMIERVYVNSKIRL